MRDVHFLAIVLRVFKTLLDIQGGASEARTPQVFHDFKFFGSGVMLPDGAHENVDGGEQPTVGLQYIHQLFHVYGETDSRLLGFCTNLQRFSGTKLRKLFTSSIGNIM